MRARARARAAGKPNIVFMHDESTDGRLYAPGGTGPVPIPHINALQARHTLKRSPPSRLRHPVRTSHRVALVLISSGAACPTACPVFSAAFCPKRAVPRCQRCEWRHGQVAGACALPHSSTRTTSTGVADQDDES